MKKATIKVFNLSGIEIFSAKVSETDAINAHDMAFIVLYEIAKGFGNPWNGYKATITHTEHSRKVEYGYLIEDFTISGNPLGCTSVSRK